MSTGIYISLRLIYASSLDQLAPVSCPPLPTETGAISASSEKPKPQSISHVIPAKIPTTNNSTTANPINGPLPAIHTHDEVGTTQPGVAIP